MGIFKKSSIGVTLCLALLAPSISQARQVCAPREEIVSQLEKKYGETLVTLGVVGDGQMLTEVFANMTSGSWTILNTYASGRSCLTIAGSGFQMVEPKEKGEES